jgi:hypothetical protein
VAAPGGRRRPIGVVLLGAAVVAGAIATAVVLAGGGKERPAATPDAPEARRVPEGSIEITSTPTAARVRIAGVDRGATPLSIALAELGGRDATIVVERPGYRSETRQVAAGESAELAVTLQPVTRFEGVWALPSGELRAFERRGEQVALYTLESASGERRFKGFFDFVSGEPGMVDFVAAEEHVDPRGADDPSCHVELRAEYVYDPAADALARRQERARIDYTGGRCVLSAKEWGESLALTRVGNQGEWAESRAGTGVFTEPKSIQNEKKLPAKKKKAKPAATELPSQDEEPPSNQVDEQQQRKAPQTDKAQKQ